ncbi:MAG: ArnT family glycosyltransferase [Nitrospinota bacterium]
MMRGKTLYLCLALLSIFSGGFLFWALSWGIGLGPDSVVYIEVARNVIKGLGFYSNSGVPLTHYPPLYPLFLASSLPFAGDPAEGAKILHSVVFSLNILLVTLIVFYVTRKSWVMAFTVGMILATSFSMFFIHAHALSEPLFLFFSLSGLMALGFALNSRKKSLFIVSGVLISLSTLSRYTGITLIFTGYVSILLFSPLPPLKKNSKALFWGLGTMAPLGCWFLRNQSVSGSPANRELTFHLFNTDYLLGFVKTVSLWLMLPKGVPLLGKIAVITILFLLSLGLYIVVCRRAKDDGRVKNRLTLIHIFSLFIFIYTGFLIFSISFVDALTPMDKRILIPVYLSLLIVLSSLIHLFSYYFKIKTGFKIAALGVLLLFITAQGVFTFSFASYVHNTGIGYNSRDWKNSEIMQRIKELNKKIIVYSNASDAINVLAARKTFSIPLKVDPGTKEKNPEFLNQIKRVGLNMKNKGAILVHFNSITWRWYLPTPTELNRILPLKLIYRGEDGLIFSIPKAPEKK